VQLHRSGVKPSDSRGSGNLCRWRDVLEGGLEGEPQGEPPNETSVCGRPSVSSLAKIRSRSSRATKGQRKNRRDRRRLASVTTDARGFKHRNPKQEPAPPGLSHDGRARLQAPKPKTRTRRGLASVTRDARGFINRNPKQDGLRPRNENKSMSNSCAIGPPGVEQSLLNRPGVRPIWR
jgi:hypothetical protein